MNTVEALRALAAVRESLAGTLVLFESGVPAPAAIERALERSTAAFDRWGALRGGLPGEDLPPEVREALEGCRRLHAVVGVLLGDRRSELAHEKSLIQKARKHLDDLRTVADKGGHCDVAG